MSVVVFLVSFLASTVGAVCGIGGGVIIKPMLDLLHIGSVQTISFCRVVQYCPCPAIL